uniref:G-protein coupled receptors family 1 profile domain-containing protein n=1 Tax=Gouania willdenowi TaxID=441366 RepID=A0A8C5G5N3_GOUWI
MELWNTTWTKARPVLLLSNCSVDTSYRYTFYQVTYTITFLVGVVTNGVALRWLCRSPMNSTAVYMVSLSTADLFFVMSLPLRIYYYHQKAGGPGGGSWTTGAVYCQLTFILKYISLYGGIFFLVCIAVDRYFAVVHPLASALRRLRAAQAVSAGIWCLVLALSVSLPLLQSAASRQSQPCMLDPSSRRHRTIILVALGLVMGAFLLPALLLLYSYCKVLSVLRQPRRGRRRTLRIIYWVLGVFLLCFLPYHVNLLGYTLAQVEVLPYCGLARVTKAAHPVVLSLASFNCCLNPLVYYFSSSLCCTNPNPT